MSFTRTLKHTVRSQLSHASGKVLIGLGSLFSAGGLYGIVAGQLIIGILLIVFGLAAVLLGKSLMNYSDRAERKSRQEY